MPARARARPAIAPDVRLLLGGGKRGSFAGINADIDHFKLIANLPFYVLQSADHAVENETAKHRAAIVAENQDDRLFPQVIAQPDEFAVLIAKSQAGGYLRPGFLVKAYFSQRVIGKRLGRRHARCA